MDESRDEAALREELKVYGLTPLDAAGHFDHARWHAQVLPPWRRPGRGWAAAAVATLAVLGAVGMLHLYPSGRRAALALHWPVAAAALPAPTMHLAALGQAGPVAFVSERGLFIASTQGVVEVSADGAAADAAWSSNAQFVSFTTPSPAGTVIHIATAFGRVVYSGVGNAFVWRPGHDEGVLVLPSGLQLLRVASAGAHPIGGERLARIAWSVLWSPHGHRLIYAVRNVSDSDSDQVYQARVGGGGLGAPRRLFASRPDTGIALAAVLPRSGSILYWTDEAQSASFMADGAPLSAWARPGQPAARYQWMLPTPQYLAVGQTSRWVYMAGAGRDISGGKSVVEVTGGGSATLSTPAAAEAIEPALNPTTGQVAAVLAANEPQAADNLDAAYRAWLATGRLAVWRRGRWQVWANAGAGVIDPIWAPNGRGLFYIDANWLWFVAGPYARPVPVVGVAVAWDYYGQVPPPVFAHG